MPKHFIVLIICAAFNFATDASAAPALSQRWDMSLSGVARLDSKFAGEYGNSLALLYRLNQNVAIQASGAWLYSRTQSLLANEVSAINDRTGAPLLLPSGSAYQYQLPIVENFRMPWFALLEAQIVPIYGKSSIFGMDLGYFDVFGSVGMGAAGRELIGVSDFARTVCMVGAFGVGADWFFGDHFGIVVQVKDFVQERYVATAGTIANSWMIQAGLRYVL